MSKNHKQDIDLVRLEEKQKTTNRIMARIEKKVDNLKESNKEFKKTCNKKFVTKEEFNPVLRTHQLIKDWSFGLIVILGGALIAVYKFFTK